MYELRARLNGAEAVIFYAYMYRTIIKAKENIIESRPIFKSAEFAIIKRPRLSLISDKMRTSVKMNILYLSSCHGPHNYPPAPDPQGLKAPYARTKLAAELVQLDARHEKK